MDIPTVWLLPLIFLIFFQLTAYSYYFNFISSFSATVVLLYILIVQHINIPTEQFIAYFTHKGFDKLHNSHVKEIDQTMALTSFDDDVTRKLRELIGHIVRDFILEWYNTVSNDVHFVQEAFELFEQLFAEIRKRISAVDCHLLLHILLNKLLRHLHDYKQSVVNAEATNKMDSSRVHQLIVVNYVKLHGHAAMENLPDTEMDHIRSLTLLLLKALLPQDYRLTGASLYLVRELISRNVLLSVIDLLSDPDWINFMLVRILEEDEATSTDSFDDSENNSITPCDTDDISEENSEDKEIVSVEMPADSVEQIHSLHENTVNAIEDIQVKFSVAANSDDLNLDVPYESQTINNPVQDSLITGQNGLSINTLCSNELSQTINVESSPNSSLSYHPQHEVALSSNSTASAPNAAYEDASTSDSDLVPNYKHFAHHSSVGSIVATPLMPHQIQDLPSKRLSLQQNRFFQRVRIPEAITTEEAFEGGSKYTLYKIEYCAPPPLPAKKKSKSAFAKPAVKDVQDHEFSDSAENDLYHFQVQRRFREFLTLQDRLNQNSVHKRLIRNVKGPSRMFPMPIGNMDKDYIEKRRKFLQAYLRELCSFSHINQSEEMKEFLAYNSDPRIAFVRRPSDIIPRFDKMLKNVVQEFIVSASEKLSDKFSGDEDTFQSATPNAEKQVQKSKLNSPFNFKPTPVVESKPIPNESFSNNMVSSSMQKLALSKTSLLNPVTKLKDIVLGKTTNVSLFEEGLREYAPFHGPKNSNDMTFGRKWRSPENLINDRTRFHATNIKGRRTQGDGCDHQFKSESSDDVSFVDDPITGQIFSLVRLVWNVNTGVNTLLYIFLARYVKSYIDIKVTALTHKNQWLRYLKNLQRALWPGGVWGGKTSENSSETGSHLKDAQVALEEAFPDALRYVVGNHRYEEGVSELLKSFQNPAINRHLVYHLLDVLVELLFPDLHEISTQTSNISM